jgi:hypothetical protein
MNLFDIFESEGEYILYFDGKPVAKYDSVYDAEFQARLVKKKVPDLNFEIKKEVCTYQPVQLKENLRDWFKDKWVRFGPDGKIRGDCARGDSSEGKPKCLPQAKAHALGKKGRAQAAARKRREDPNPERHGAAINVNTKKKSNEGIAEGLLSEMDKSAPQPGRDGRVSHNTYGSRDKGDSKGPEKEAKPITAKKAKQDALDILKKQGVAEEWSQKYKNSINCSHPKGFSQKAHCAGKKKHNESVEMEMTCPDCGMCQTHGDHSKDKLDELKCWPGHHRVAGTKAGFPGSCAKNKTNEEDVTEGSTNDYFKRRKDEEDRIAGTKAPAKRTPQQTDYAKRRAQEKKIDEQGVAEEKCPHCSGPMFSELMINEKKDACYYKVKSRYKVWPSAYASGALVKCRKKGADSWGNKSESLNEFASPDSGDGSGPDEEEILFRLAQKWWTGSEQDMIRAQRTLEAMGWEIGEDEGYDNGGVFVVRAGDEHGKSYISWPHEDLQSNEGMAEASGSNLVTQYGDTILAQKGQTVSEDSSMHNVKEYYNVVGTNPTTLRKEFHMSKDKIGWFLKEGSTPRHKLDAIRAFGSPKLKEYDLAAFSGGTQTKGEDNVISPVGSKTRAQYKK